MTGQYNPFPEESPVALLGEHAGAVPQDSAVPSDSPMALVSGPGAGPEMPRVKGATPGIPRGEQAVPGMPAPGRQSAPAPAGGYQGLDQNYETAYRQALKQRFPELDDTRLQALGDYGMAKQRGRIAAQQKKLLAQPLGKYFSSLQAESTARANTEAVMESLKHRKAEFMNPDGTMAPEWAPYQDKLDAAIKRADAAKKNRMAIQQHLEKMGIKSNYLESPVTVMEFMRQLASGDPQTAGEMPDDDPIENFGDDPADPYSNPGAQFLQ